MSFLTRAIGGALALGLLAGCGGGAGTAQPAPVTTTTTAQPPVAATSRSATAVPPPSTTALAPPSSPVSPPGPLPPPTAAQVRAPTSPPQPVPPALPGPGRLPVSYNGGAAELITVIAPSASSTTGTLTAWTRSAAGWRNAFGPVAANLGADGVGTASEAASRTPAGVYSLTQSFGRQANPGAALPYFQTTTADWWDENPSSPSYNTHVHRQNSPGGSSENLYTSGAVYDYVVNIDSNSARVPGAGSAIFLHVSNGAPTAGCVAIPRATLVNILRWLTPAAHPQIDIAVA
ncbi:MAG: L,D-transpeptidase family protein [Mycobacteriaceae bacterium]